MAYTKDQIMQIVREAAARYGIDESIALRQIKQESGFNPTIGSNKGALGVAQFTAPTAARFGLTDRTDPVASMDAWGKYMTYLLNRFDGDYSLALAGYNAGEGAVEKYGRKIPPYKETQNYVKAIMGGITPNPTSGSSPNSLPVAGLEPTMTTGLPQLNTTTIITLAAVAALAYLIYS